MVAVADCRGSVGEDGQISLAAGVVVLEQRKDLVDTPALVVDVEVGQVLLIGGLGRQVPSKVVLGHVGLQVSHHSLHEVGLREGCGESK